MRHKGVEAQTLANAYLAVENNLEIVPMTAPVDNHGLACAEFALRRLSALPIRRIGVVFSRHFTGGFRP
jgi:hypothetical protein